ncbi:MAG: FkbM family methyltransferase [Verrucomicrobiaceae bacterium]|nr:FkbM family methyltransferase [Verrucomicrobiaceae bacterium]
MNSAATAFRLPESLPSKRWRTLLARLVYPYGAVRRVLLGPAAGTPFHVAPGMGLMYALGADHRRALALLADHLPLGGVFYDIGANQGQFSIGLAQVVGSAGLVVAVEPLPENQRAFAANLALGHYPQVKMVGAAISASGGSRPFLFDTARSTMGTFAGSAVKLDDASSGCLTVDTLTLDELAAGQGRMPDCIKIDVEGAADEVLAGASEVLGSARPNLLVELHLSDKHDREKRAVTSLVERFDYSISMFDGQPLGVVRPPGEYQAWCVPRSR